jgi:tRNA pseudouridine65 synthase
MQLRVLAQGEGWRVVAKPSGLPVHRSRMVDEKRTLIRAARLQFGEDVSPVHRLDRPTSGCLLLSDGPEHTPGLQEALARGQKWYLAFVRGRVGSMDPVRVATPMKDPEGVLQDAATVLIPVGGGAEPRCSLILAIPETGRWHQIRRHVRDLSHPVIGDSTHGDTRINRWWRETFGLDRLALHCVSLSLPREGAPPIEATCPIPADLRRVWEQLPWWAEAVARLPALAERWEAA